MFDNKLRMRQKNNNIEGGVVISGVVIRSKEPIDGNVKAAYAKVMQAIMTAAEFFPIKDCVGPETFQKAVELFVTLKKGDAAQKAEANRQIKTILSNSRSKGDPTAQDVDYALARLQRQYTDAKFNISGGDFTFDALGFSPANLRKNLDAMASRSEPMRRAKEIYTDIVSGDPKRRQLAKSKLRNIKRRIDNGGETVVGRAILLGVAQYVKANNAKAVREQLLGNENVTIGLSFGGLKKAVKKAVKKTGSAVKKVATNRVVQAAATGGASEAARAAKKIGVKRAVAALATGGASEVVRKAAKAKGIGRVAAAIATGGASEAARKIVKKKNPKLATPKGDAALKLTAKAKTGDPQAIAQIRDLKAKADEGVPEAVEAMDTLEAADEAIEDTGEQMANQVVDKAVEQAAEEAAEEATDESFAEDAEEEEEEGEVEYDEDGLAVAPTEIVGRMLDGEIGFSLKNALKSVAKTVVKQVTPLAATAANAFAPGSGALIAKALPALVDTLPSDKRPKNAQIAKGMAVVKAADEMNPEALQKIETIKALAAQGVPQAEIALNALKVAKGTQKLAESVVTAQSQTAQKVEALANKSPDPIPVKIVSWGK